MGNLSPTLPDVAIAYETACSSDDMLIEQLKAMPGEITLLAIGPLTNLAAAERKVPGILNLAAEIVIMGGAFNTPGNITPAAEFNIAYDPEAAALVFSRCHNLVVLPLDITRRLIFTNQMAQQIAQAKPDSAIAQFVVNLCQFMTTTALAFRETSGVAGFLVHDAVTLAYLFYPELLHFRRGQVWIETQGDWSRGKTLIDDRHQPKASANAWVAIDVDAGNLLAALIADLKYLILA